MSPNNADRNSGKNQQFNTSTNYSLRTYLTFLIPSLIGLFLFMVPIHYQGDYTITIALLSKLFVSSLSAHAKCTISAIIMFMMVVSIFYRIYQPYLLLRSEFIHKLLYPTLPWFLIRILGGIFLILSLLKIGPEFVWGEYTGMIMRERLLPSLLGVFIFAGFFLPLLSNFGLLEFIGAFLAKVMRPVFNLPGRSAVDCLTSWLGDSSIGILLTNKQYEDKHYTQKEAAIVGTTFSTVSITFSVFIITYVGLGHLFLPFYLTICLAGLIAAIILPHLPPLRYKKDRFIDGSYPDKNREETPKVYSTFRWAYMQALNKANSVTSYKKVIQDGCKNVVEIVFGLLPVIMALGTSSLIIAEYTPIFEILSKPFVFYLNLLAVPESAAASEAIASGFSNIVQPAFNAASIGNEETRFIVATVSVSQLIYMIEVGALLLGSKIPINIFELLIIFILRTLITLPIIVGVSHLIF